jgi:hypothetical protein
MLKRRCLGLVLALAAAPAAFGGALLYDNTTTDTYNALLYSAGAYTGIGDQVRLAFTAPADFARLQLFNAGGAGVFDVELRFFETGAPVGAQIGGPFTVTGIASAGFDVLDVTFDLDGLALPQDVIFVASVRADPWMDLGLTLFQPPAIGSSDETSLIVADDFGFNQAFSANENVYFQITAIPEPSTFALIASALLLGCALRRRPPLR